MATESRAFFLVANVSPADMGAALPGMPPAYHRLESWLYVAHRAEDEGYIFEGDLVLARHEVVRFSPISRRKKFRLHGRDVLTAGWREVSPAAKLHTFSDVAKKGPAFVREALGEAQEQLDVSERSHDLLGAWFHNGDKVGRPVFLEGAEIMEENVYPFT